MKTPHTKAFTLTELLVVVIVIGVLSAVILPKFGKVVETRKTTEAEELMSAVRTEQEKRCALDKNYLTDLGSLQEVLPAGQTKNFSYTLTPTGIEAQNKGSYLYTLKMPSYADGRLCCEDAERCGKLNKDYPLCSELTARADYQSGAGCSGDTPTVTVPADPCEAEPNQPGCCRAPMVWVESTGRCEPKISCTGEWVYNPAINRCEAPSCPADWVWNADTGRCEETPPQCNAVYGAWSTVDRGTSSDTCPGSNTQEAYTCTDDFKGICTDIRRGSVSTSTAQTDQYEPLRTTPLGGWGLNNFNPVELNDSCNGDIHGVFRCDGKPQECIDVSNSSANGVVVRAEGFLTGGTLPPACPTPSSGSFITNNGQANVTIGQGSVNMNQYCLETLRDKQEVPGTDYSVTGVFGQIWGAPEDLAGFQGQAGRGEPGFYCTVTFDTITSSTFEPITLETVLGMRCQYSASFTKVICVGPKKEYDDVRTVNCCSSTGSTAPEGPVTSVPSVTTPTVSVAP